MERAAHEDLVTPARIGAGEEPAGSDNHPSLMDSALDRKRAASMADEGRVSAAAIESQEWLASTSEVLRAWRR